MVDSAKDDTPILDRASNNKLLDSRGRCFNWLAVVLLCFLPFGKSFLNSCLFLILSALAFVGNYYCDDTPAGLQDVMKEDLQISSSTFTSFYSWYSWPNVV